MGLYPVSVFNQDLSLSMDISGAPATAAATDGVYFAFSGKGTNARWQIASYENFYSLFIGFTHSDGTLGWIKNFDELQAKNDCYSPVLTLGPAADLYVAFVTNGAIPGYANGGQFPPAPNTATFGPADVVLSRINVTMQTVAWATQGAGLNGPANQTVPQLALDTTYGWVYLAYQSSGNIYTYTSIGKTNIVLSCFNMIAPSPPGISVWTTGFIPNFQDDTINCTDFNTNPSIATDNNGSVYLAYELTSAAPHGAPVSGRQIEVVKYTTVNYNTPLNPIYKAEYQWTLSGLNPKLFVTNGMSSSPRLVYNSSFIYLSYFTTGTVTGSTHSKSNNDIVLVALTPTGDIAWIQQGLTNVAPQQYLDVYAISSCVDSLGFIYLAATVRKKASRDSVLVWKLDPMTGTPVWNYSTNYQAYSFAYTSGKNAVYPSKAYEFTTVSIAALTDVFYVGYTTLDPIPGAEVVVTPNHFVGISGFSPRIYVDTVADIPS